MHPMCHPATRAGQALVAQVLLDHLAINSIAPSMSPLSLRLLASPTNLQKLVGSCCVG